MCAKMSQLHAELSEQAFELGFGSIEEAEANGYTIDYEKSRLLHPYKLVKEQNTDDEQEKAHEAQLLERDEIVEELTTLRDDAADLAMGTGIHTDEWSKVALLADKVANYIKKEVK